MATARQYTVDELKELQGIFGGEQAQKDLVPPHGNNALLNSAGVRPAMPSAIPVRRNWSATLPMFKSEFTNDLIEIFTGITADSGSNPTDTCSPGPNPGNLKTMQILRTFGLFHMDTQEVNIVKLGERKNRADISRRFRNQPDIAWNPFMPDVVNANPDVINSAMGKSLYEFGISQIVPWSQIAFHGLASRAAGAGYLGWIDEPDGIDHLVRTGYTDNRSNVAAPAADSRVVNYGAVIGTDFVLELSNLIRHLEETAEITGMMGTQFEIVVNPRMRYEIIDTWSCNYITARCQPDATNGVRVNAETIHRLKNEMLRGNYLLIDGVAYPLRTEVGLEVTQNQTTGQWTSDIFVIPVEYQGQALTYWEFKGFDHSEIMAYVRDGFNDYKVTNGGMFLMTNVSDRTCKKFQFNSKPRMMLDYPFLAGRLDDVTVNDNVQARSAYRGDPYFVNGGQYYLE